MKKVKSVVEYIVVPGLILTVLATIFIKYYYVNQSKLRQAQGCVGRKISSCNLGSARLIIDRNFGAELSKATEGHSLPRPPKKFNLVHVYDDKPVGILLVYCDSSDIVVQAEEVWP